MTVEFFCFKSKVLNISIWFLWFSFTGYLLNMASVNSIRPILGMWRMFWGFWAKILDKNFSVTYWMLLFEAMARMGWHWWARLSMLSYNLIRVLFFLPPDLHNVCGANLCFMLCLVVWWLLLCNTCIGPNTCWLIIVGPVVL